MASIPPNGTTVVALTFQPQSAGAKSATVVMTTLIPTFPPAVNTLSVALTGTGVAPTLSSQLIVSPDPLDFGAVPVGGQATLGFTLSNRGPGPTGTIQISGNLSGSQFTIQSSSVPPPCRGRFHHLVADLPSDGGGDRGGLRPVHRSQRRRRLRRGDGQRDGQGCGVVASRTAAYQRQSRHARFRRGDRRQAGHGELRREQHRGERSGDHRLRRHQSERRADQQRPARRATVDRGQQRGRRRRESW